MLQERKASVTPPFSECCGPVGLPGGKIKYYLALKGNNEVPIHATTLMNLENIKLNEGSQTRKAMSGDCICTYKISRSGRSTAAARRSVVVRGWGVGGIWGDC